DGIAPIIIPTSSSGQTPLQIQFGTDILACQEITKECQLWTKGTNQWNTFPSLSKTHIQGSMSLLGNSPIVIGGKQANRDWHHGVVEIFDLATNQWILGPTLSPVRRGHASVVLNETSLVVVGGYSGGTTTNSVKILDVRTMTWNDLDSLQKSADDMACGLLNVTSILCIGGWSKSPIPEIQRSAYVLDMSLSKPKWEAKPLFDTSEPIRYGFIYHLRDSLFIISIYTSNNQEARTLRRMDLKEKNPTWNTLALDPDSSYLYVSFYLLHGYELDH
ncbi:hypothetical protein TCAL_12318, partial [Tigriopus californicus]